MEGIETKLNGSKWAEIAAKFLSEEELQLLKQIPKSKLLSSIQLQMAVGKTRAKKVVKQILPILPEVNFDAKRRCVFVKDGVRCDKFTDAGMCKDHMNNAYKLTNVFKNQRLQDQLNKHMKSPQKMHLDMELSMMRVMLSELCNLANSSGADQLPLSVIQSVTVLCDKIGAMVDRMNGLNKITPETIEALLNGVIKVMSEYIPPDKLVEATEKVIKLHTVDPTCDIEFVPGNEIEVEGHVHTITAPSIQQRALEEVASSLGIHDE